MNIHIYDSSRKIPEISLFLDWLLTTPLASLLGCLKEMTTVQ